MPKRMARAGTAVAAGLIRSTVFALCALLIPVCIGLLPTLAAYHLVGSPWSWSNPWSWVGLAIITIAVTLALAHLVAGLFRRLIARWSGVRLAPGYREQPEPVRLSTGYWWNGSSYERTREDALTDLRLRRIQDRAYWREVRWAVVAAIVVAPVCAVPAVALVGAFVLIVHATPWSIGSGGVLVVLAAAVAPLAWRIVRPLAEWSLTATTAIPPPATELRVQRADLTAAHDAEIRRIERDLHDGAQSRLIAVGLDLATAERLLKQDPDRAKAMLRAARAGTAASLNDLRELVHSVYPPVLIERGLVPAIRALALDSPVPVTVDGPDGLRIPSPLAAALYFSASELLANIAKHAHASSGSVTVVRSHGRIDVVIRDDGAGGASLRSGGGLDGVRRRLDVFDATLDVVSPPGGPSVMTVRMPCESS